MGTIAALVVGFVAGVVAALVLIALLEVLRRAWMRKVYEEVRGMAMERGQHDTDH